jgi:hypothetical protein
MSHQGGYHHHAMCTETNHDSGKRGIVNTLQKEKGTHFIMNREFDSGRAGMVMQRDKSVIDYSTIL